MTAAALQLGTLRPGTLVRVAGLVQDSPESVVYPACLRLASGGGGEGGGKPAPVTYGAFRDVMPASALPLDEAAMGRYSMLDRCVGACGVAGAAGKGTGAERASRAPTPSPSLHTPSPLPPHPTSPRSYSLYIVPIPGESDWAREARVNPGAPSSGVSASAAPRSAKRGRDGDAPAPPLTVATAPWAGDRRAHV